VSRTDCLTTLQQPSIFARLVLWESHRRQALLPLCAVCVLCAEALPPAAAAVREAVWCAACHCFKEGWLEDLVGVTGGCECLHLLPEGQVVTDVAAGVLEGALVVLAPEPAAAAHAVSSFDV
jgi:hypothetical protein